MEHREDIKLINQGEYAQLLGIGESTLYKWAREGEKGDLKDKRPVPRHFPLKTDIETVQKVIETYLQFPHWGGRKISDYLLNNQIVYIGPGAAQKIKNKVDALVDESGYRLEITTRYEALKPNDMWTTDLLQFDWYGETLYIALVIDDNSRHVLNWGINKASYC